ncbi:uncharacterized protein V6R79_013684 [Siganus canaliculatus]
MNVQLLLLLALAGPFCAFTHASPTVLPTELDDGKTHYVTVATPEVTNAPVEDFTVITGPPPTEPVAAPEQVEVTEAVTESAPPSTPVFTEEPAAETQAPTAAATAAAEAHVTDAPVEKVETAAPPEPEGAQTEPVATAPAKAPLDDDVVIEDDVQEGLSSGQVVGIVIGALLAVIILIAVVIAVVRRMGKYSP